MALNLTPDYFEADRKYRQAHTPEEKLAALEEMLRTIPKHKASEKKQADIKRRISELREAPAKKKGAAVDPYHIPPQGGGQALLLGLPNSGKSSIVGCLTKAAVKITDFPFGTALPVPGMAHHEDVPIELVDLPPVTPDHMPPGMLGAIRNTNVLLLVVDSAADSVLEDLDTLLNILRSYGLQWDRASGDDEASATREDDASEPGLAVGPHALIVCNKCDLPAAAANLEVLRELRTSPPPMMPVSALTGEGLKEMLAYLFSLLGVIRVYTKLPGKPPDREKPFVLPAGSTVGELARMIHKDIADHLKHARIWGEKVFNGQQVHATHVLDDRDVVELHT
ncbi:MAG TPA: TGS domain-containing protein [Phycisphaerae bacterium]|nr:TGS domain-containing protein [Phycisphaerae bacterium]HRY68477.1 TGS domain-containing protein [Phycisphaerae bacterium]HSA29528.1 TGS domain-containing protein [Phycisphaerae bacterium]